VKDPLNIACLATPCKNDALLAPEASQSTAIGSARPLLIRLLSLSLVALAGLVLSDFKQQLFGLLSIQSYITRGKTNVCICEFEYDEAQALSTPVAPPLSQLSQLSQTSQLSQMSQYSANHMDMGGYPFGMSYGMP
jgi:hypothetical protein